MAVTANMLGICTEVCYMLYGIIWNEKNFGWWLNERVLITFFWVKSSPTAWQLLMSFLQHYRRHFTSDIALEIVALLLVNYSDVLDFFSDVATVALKMKHCDFIFGVGYCCSISILRIFKKYTDLYVNIDYINTTERFLRFNKSYQLDNLRTLYMLCKILLDFTNKNL